jgi:hypothetical protein
MRVEIWLCRVLFHPTTRAPMNVAALSPESDQLVMAKIINGEIGSLPDGTIIEPITAHPSESDANEARARAMRDNPAGDYRVVMTMGVA